MSAVVALSTVTAVTECAPRASSLALTWARLFVHALADAGVKHAVVSPGSRSTPLVLALAEQTRIACDVIVDERCAGFFALGIARVSGEPVALVCTSGTAGAHYFPAVLEAAAAGVPLVIVTADRPWELQDAGALQTMDQTKLYGTHVRFAAELGTPSPEPAAMRAVMRVAAQAVHAARPPQAGPVHVNARFRKPLEPALVREPLTAWEREANALMAHGATRAVDAHAQGAPDEATLCALAARIAGQRGVIVCGPACSHHDPRSQRAAVLVLARTLGFKLACEATSQARFGARGEVDEVALVDALFANNAPAPELILQLGDLPTSAAYQRFVAAHPQIPRIVLGARAWSDPDGSAEQIVFGDIRALCNHLAKLCAKHPAPVPAPHRSSAATTAPATAFAERDVARVMIDALAAHATDDEATLVVANSRCLRAVDAFEPRTDVPLRVVHQRGVSGIDGMIAGAAGVRRAARGPVGLLLGDVAALHDLGGLAAARDAAGPLAIVIVDNDGGRIFEDLPLADAVSRATMRRFFLTPPRVDFAHAARAFGLDFARACSEDALARALDNALAAQAPHVIHVVLPCPDRSEAEGEMNPDRSEAEGEMNPDRSEAEGEMNPNDTRGAP